MTLTLSLHNGDMYSVHLLTEETILVNQIQKKHNTNMKSNVQIIDLQLWPWVGMVETYGLHTVSMSWIVD